MKQMRSSIILLGALFGRMGEGSCGYPGGCLIGSRPIDLHLKALSGLGAQVEEENLQVQVKAAEGKRPKGGRILLRYPSVGATEQALLGAGSGEGRNLYPGSGQRA